IDKLSRSLDRLNIELDFAEGFLKQRSDAECEAEVKAVRQMVAQRADSLTSASVDDFVAECEGMLAKTAARLKSITVHMVSHAHIDMNWMWAYDETVAVTLDTFATMLKLMDIYPDFTFSQSQASVYRIVQRYNPAMLQQIAQRVSEGRWEVSSATWVEHDKNMSAGETQIRQVLYSKKFFKETFGLGYDDVKLDFEPDTFGHSINTPAILSEVGVKYYYHCRAYRGNKLYRWQSPNGGELLCYLEKDDWYNWDVSPRSIADSVLRELKDTGLDDVLRVYGVGDHGGGPTVRDIQAILTAAGWPVFPNVKFSTYSNYFSQAEAARDRVPVVTGEHNFVFTGCYTSQSDIKRGNRYSEKSLVMAEKFASLAQMLSSDFEYPSDNLTSAWENVLFNQFHDILPGSGVSETRRYAMGKYQEVYAAASSAKKAALASIANQVNTSALPSVAGVSNDEPCDRALGAGVGFWHNDKGISAPGINGNCSRIFTVFNPSPFERSEVVEAVLWDMDTTGGLAIKDSSGKDVTFQIIEHNSTYWSHRFRVILFEAENVPAMGYKSFIVYDDKSKPKDNPGGWDARMEDPVDLTLENEHLKITLDSVSGSIKSMIMNDGNLELVPEGERTALFRVIDESGVFGGGMSSWIVGSYAKIEPMDGVRFSSLPRQTYERIVEKFTLRRVSGPLRNGYAWAGKIRGSEMLVGIYLDKGSKSVRIDCKCDWLEKGTQDTFVPQLNITMPLAISDTTHNFEVPFGSIERKDRNLDLPALRWVDMSGKHTSSGNKVGMTVMTDSKYGFRVTDDSISVSLIRSSFDPDLYPEFGEHRFSLSLSPHQGACVAEDSTAAAESFDQPLVVFQNTTHDGSLPVDSSLIEIRNRNVVLSALKKQEDGNGVMLRLSEVSGKDTDAEIVISPQLFGGEVKVFEADSLERPVGDVKKVSDGIMRMKIPANGIMTLLLSPAY
ncbi:glycosyl hydrolase-related protein, partial [bacterium]|nr:glycosyl hydrolase-related protein [bacterium]